MKVVRQDHKEAFCASIMDITTGAYVTEETKGTIKLGSYAERLLFYDEMEAEAILQMLNENYADCFTLVIE